jgi:hypothetical protein
MFHDHRSRDHLEATQQLSAHLLQHLAKESGMPISALA